MSPGTLARRFLELLVAAALVPAARHPDNPGRALLAALLLGTTRLAAGLETRDRRALLGALLFSLLLAEGILRGLDHPWARVARLGGVRRGSLTLGWELAPGSGGLDPGGYRVTVNRQGLRGPELPDPRPPGQKRVLLIGDSFVFGFGVDDDRTLGAQLQQLLDPSRARLDVLNGGVPAYNGFQIRTWLATRGPGLQPDLVVYGCYFNDVGAPGDAAEAEARGRTILADDAFDRGTGHSYLVSFLRNAYDMLWYYPHQIGKPGLVSRPERKQYVESAGGAYLRGTLSPDPLFLQLDAMQATARTLGIPLVVLAVPDLVELATPEFGEFRRRLAAHCQAAELPFLDPAPRLEAAPDPDSFYMLPRDFHLGASGHRVLAETLAPAVRTLLGLQ